MTQLEGKGRNLGSGVKRIWIQILVLPFAGRTYLDKLINLSEPRFPYVKIRENKICPVTLLTLKMLCIKWVDAPQMTIDFIVTIILFLMLEKGVYKFCLEKNMHFGEMN